MDKNLIKYLKFNKSSTKKTLKSEPTISKRNYVKLNIEKNIKSKIYVWLEELR